MTYEVPLLDHTQQQYEEMKKIRKPSSFARCGLTEKSKADLLKGLYWYFEFSLLDIAELFHMTPGLVRDYMEKYQIPRRPRGQALSLAFKQGKIKRHYKKGKEHFNWRGGTTINAEGYISIHRPEHPRANRYGYVREHIVIWEEAHGTPLPKGWVVHHLNGIPSDNRPENLVALPDRKHKTVLAVKAQRIKELESRLSKAEREIESLHQAMLAGQLTFSVDGHRDSSRL